MIHFDDVSKSFDSLSVLNDVSFAIDRGHTAGLIGPSGSGKTTLLRLIVGALPPDTGSVIVETESIGYVFQEPRLLPWRTALQNIALPLRARGYHRTDALQYAAKWLSQVGLQGFEDYYPTQLSGGMLQRVSIGRALAISPEVLLMDEPFSSLNMELRESLLSLVADIIADGQLSTLYVTHYLPEAMRLADSVMQLDCNGRLQTLSEEYRKKSIAALLRSISHEWTEAELLGRKTCNETEASPSS